MIKEEIVSFLIIHQKMNIVNDHTHKVIYFLYKSLCVNPLSVPLTSHVDTSSLLMNHAPDSHYNDSHYIQQAAECKQPSDVKKRNNE